MIAWRLFSAVAAAIVAMTTLVSPGETADQPTTAMGPQKPIASKSEAYTRTLSYLGPILPPIDSVVHRMNDIVTRKVSQDTTFPFLSDSLRGRPCWEIRVSGIDLEPLMDEFYRTDKPSVKDFVVRLDSASGVLSSVQFFSPGEDPDSWERSAEFSQYEIENMAAERYHGFPAVPPSVSLLEALEIQRVANPVGSKYAVARYVLHTSRVFTEPTPAWAVHMFGFGADGRSPRSQMRCVIDAVTGEGRGCINLPWAAPVDTTGKVDSARQ